MAEIDAYKRKQRVFRDGEAILMAAKEGLFGSPLEKTKSENLLMFMGIQIDQSRNSILEILKLKKGSDQFICDSLIGCENLKNDPVISKKGSLKLIRNSGPVKDIHFYQAKRVEIEKFFIKIQKFCQEARANVVRPL